MLRIPTLWLAASLITVPFVALAVDKPAPAPAPHVVAAPVPAYTLVKEKSFLKFVAIQNSAPVEGKFTDFTADIRFDPNQLDKSSVKVEVNMAKIEVANEEVEQNLALPEWLSVKEFPKAEFTCTKLTRMPMSDNYYADGQLTLRGKTLPAVLNFQMDHFDDKTAIAKGSVTLHRLPYGIGQGQWAKDDVIKDEVRVEFRVVAQKQ